MEVEESIKMNEPDSSKLEDVPESNYDVEDDEDDEDEDEDDEDEDDEDDEDEDDDDDEGSTF